ncbi:hypothetical protein AB0F71_27925 [Kitasatospora sp. NPDC028055]|uniref:hypothetical protein n=1 Tax=Kitasatospora sp. NPDC028055 TaxID=3155653 RepID=UPI003405EBBB
MAGSVLVAPARRAGADGDTASTTALRRRIADGFVAAHPQARQVPAVRITSGADRSVHLVGSSISALKPWIPGGIPDGGILAVQPAVRTQNLRTLGDCVTPFGWGGHFTNFSIVLPAGSGTAPAERTLAFFLDHCGFAPADVLVRASREHPGLFPAVGVFAEHVRVEWDSRDPRYYTHTVGIPGVHGVNFNVALRHPVTGEYDDVGNYIDFVPAGTPDTAPITEPITEPFTEVGFGDTTILRAQLGLDHVLDAFPFPAGPTADRWTNRHLQDAFLVSAVLWNEGLRPCNRDARTKLLRKYLEACRAAVTRSGLGRSELRAWLAGLYAAEGFAPADLDGIWSEHLEDNLWT